MANGGVHWGCSSRRPPARAARAASRSPAACRTPAWRAGDLWLAILLTLLGVGLVVWAVERWWWVGGKAGRAGLPTLHDRIFQSVGRPMQTADMWSDSFASSLIIVLFCECVNVGRVVFWSAAPSRPAPRRRSGAANRASA